MITETDSMDQIVAKAPGLSRRLKIGLGVAAGTVALAVALAPSLQRWARAEQSVDLDRLQIATVVRGDLQRDVSAQGKIVAANHPRLYSPAQGIVSLTVKAGEAVKAGTVLATITSPDLRSQLAQESARLQSMQSDLARSGLAARQQNQGDEQTVKLRRVSLESARRDLQRAETLRTQGLMNEVDYERSRDAVRIAEVQLEQADQGGGLGREARDFEVEDRRRQVERQRLVVADLERRVGELTVRAPFDGLVATVDAQDRDAVPPNAPLLTLVDLAKFEVQVEIPESYAAEAAVGTPAAVSFGGREVPRHPDRRLPRGGGRPGGGDGALRGRSPRRAAAEPAGLRAAGLRDPTERTQGPPRAVPRSRRRTPGLCALRRPRHPAPDPGRRHQRLRGGDRRRLEGGGAHPPLRNRILQRRQDRARAALKSFSRSFRRFP